MLLTTCFPNIPQAVFYRLEQINILVGGPAGTGIESVTHSLCLAFTRDGLHAITQSEYENVIRGGHSFASVHAAEKPLKSHQLHYDLLIAMDKLTLEMHKDEVDAGGAIIYDGEKTKTEDIEFPTDVEVMEVPLHRLAKEAGLALAANVVAVGAALAVFGWKQEAMKTVLETIFQRKGDDVVRINHKALQAGFDFVANEQTHRIKKELKGDNGKRFVMSGNEAIALGCIRAGVKFLAAYPMTPGSTIMTTLAKEARNYDIVVVHAEDEIASANMAIGAGYAGLRAATSTSGGGMSLKSEAMSLAGQMEVPVVVFDAQRPGPSTGLPTRTGQGDLRMVMHCGQGDFPRMVIAVGDHEECVQLSAEAFNYAERFQVPVVVLTEKYIADQYRSCEYSIADGITIDRGKVVKEVPDPENFKRFLDTPDGVSPRSIPGVKGGEHSATSYEHNEYGKAEEEVPGVKVMMEKRWRKVDAILQAIPAPKVYGEGDHVVMIWGATKNPALAAQEILQQKGMNIKIVQMQFIFPFKTEAVLDAVGGYRSLIFVEGNQSGQLEGVFAEHAGIRPDHSIRDYYGRPMTGEWIAEQIEDFLQSLT